MLFRLPLLVAALVSTMVMLASPDAEARKRADLTNGSTCSLDNPKPVSELSEKAQKNPMLPPGINGYPVPVDVGVYVEQLTHISEADYSFNIQAFVDMIWCDPRLAFDAEEAGTDRKVLLEEEAHKMLGSMWWPDLTFVNAAAPMTVRHEELILFSDGTVIYEEEIAGPMRAQMDLTQFPFDRHEFLIQLESFAWPSMEMVLKLEEDKIGFSEAFNMPSWTLMGYEASIETVQEVRDRDPFSEFVMVIHAERIYWPYVFRLFIPLLLIMVASWSVFWLRPGAHDRLAVTFTTILTVVALNFIVTGRLPDVPEITYLESVFGFSFLFLLLVVIENTVIDWKTRTGQDYEAERIDSFARVAFPLLFIAGVTTATFAFGIHNLL